MFGFSNKSLLILNSVDIDLQTVFNEVIKITNIDFGISHGYRTPSEQFELFKNGRTYVNNKLVINDISKVVTYKDGINSKSKHNIREAVDIYVYFKNYKSQAYNKCALSYIAGIVRCVSELFYNNGKIKRKVIWGGNWDDDDDFTLDHTFVDYPHFELE
jgi:hypothetical protein